jgi:Rrf2 family iron-sulfur cluster assembly transcriptional regulator
MRITAVEEYGLRCLLALASKGPQGQLSISEIAEMEGLSVPYASKLLAILRRAGLVLAARGRGGGFTIAKRPEEITLYEALTLLGGPLIDPNHCQKHTGLRDQCVHIENCSVHDILGGLAGYVQEFLSRTTLKDLVGEETAQSAKKAAGEVTLAPTALKEELEHIGNRVHID